MAIAAKPKKHQNDIDTSSNEDPALKFIESAGQPVMQTVTTPTKVAADPKPIIVRGIDEELMERLDREAARRRVSRAAMVRMLLVEHLPE
jgi:hypothetical protein